VIIIDTARPEARHEPVVLLFGVGLIGHSILDELQHRRPVAVTVMPYDWSDSSQRKLQVQAIEERTSSIARNGSAVRIVWSAGRAGFLSSVAETETELASFRDVLALAERLTQNTHTQMSFHVISSAGGLFEGQRHVAADAVPAPMRPYGVLKMREEELVRNSTNLSSHRIYRLSSAYGYIRTGTRAGLVAKLISDGLRRSVTHMNGTMRTLRDFVFACDIGAYIAEQLLDPDVMASDVSLLVRARPCSLLEVQQMIEEVMGRKLYVTYVAEAVNSADITFSSDACPARWSPSDLRANIGRIYRAALSSSWS